MAYNQEIIPGRRLGVIGGESGPCRGTVLTPDESLASILDSNLVDLPLSPPTKIRCSCCGAPGRRMQDCSCRGGKSHLCLRNNTAAAEALASGSMDISGTEPVSHASMSSDNSGIDFTHIGKGPPPRNAAKAYGSKGSYRKESSPHNLGTPFRTKGSLLSNSGLG